jgi:hypothetical protein
MSRRAIRPSPARSRARRRRLQGGQSLISTLAITTIVAFLVIASLSWARSSTGQSTRQVREDRAMQAAEAGVQTYISRMVEDPRYSRRYVDVAEDPRIDTTTGGTVTAGNPWVPGHTWTYSGPPQNWRPLQDARFGQASYSLRIVPANDDPTAVYVQSTARVMPSGGANPVVRSVQARVQPISIADFQMISDQTISYGSSATTTGKIYSARDVIHAGTAKAPVYAQNLACRSGGGGCSSSQAGNSGFQGGAYDKTTSPSFKQKFPTPIDFTSFTEDLTDIKAAAQATGIYKNDPTANAWEVQFLSNGQVKVWKAFGSDLGRTLTRLGCPETFAMPTGNVPFYMYFEQSVIVGNGNSITDDCAATSGARASVVNGQATVASKGNVYIGNNISYAAEGDDVLGLIGAGEIIITEYTPTNLNWRAATLAQNGQWRTNRGDTTKSSMVFTGSMATADGGYASMFGSRTYEYDTVLQYLRPPLFPTIEGTWGVVYWREVLAPA